ncbi:hypothetical protein DPMN_064047 [Dreissena polymorpha]|uniref:Uncharacterized protein n=1 Tax=Dreissena polymorpha TaxID=45954 RepID=A0A9D4HJ52_DREPO|nr:hypothetical protein DPMN_064047 [Dreissena polymorpha]
MESLPFEHLLPGLLVVGIVDVDDVGHVILTYIILLPAPTYRDRDKKLTSEQIDYFCNLFVRPF